MNKLTRAQKAAITQRATEILEAQEQDLARHHRLCEVCKHPACSLIQEAFLQWTSPEVIMKKYGLKSRATIYNHAHAFGLFVRRDRTLRFALGHIIEQADRVNVTARDVIQAVYTYAHVNDDGLWVQPASQSEIVVSKNEAAASPLESSQALASPLVRSASKPNSRRRALRYVPSTQDLGEPRQEPDADMVAAYVQAAAPDAFVPSRDLRDHTDFTAVLFWYTTFPDPTETPAIPTARF